MNKFFAKIPYDITSQLPNEYQNLDDFWAAQDTLDYSLEQLGGYFHKYFPRSYIETDTLFSYLLKYSLKYRNILSEKKQISILDVGCGIGANTIALAKNLDSNFPNLDLIKIDAVDGNNNALDYQQNLIKNWACFIARFTFSRDKMNF
ncbi:MAG: hypothetical protein HQK61_08500 [Desulfamplus sp.]|nr:hypothetical protein [Desulfamplus sp.]